MHSRYSPSRRKAWLTWVVAITVGGCDDPLPPEEFSSRPPLPAVVVSDAAPRDSAAAPLAYVSLRPGLIVGAEHATIRNARTGETLTVPIVAGGFDPVAVAASAGDTLELDIRMRGDTVLTFGLLVPERRPPVVVRTDPPPRKRDVPLNAAMLIVFSEPIDPATLTSATVQLLRRTLLVGGRLEFADSARLSATFAPDAALAPSTDYELVVTEGIRDLDAEPLASPVSVGFTTEGCGGTPNSIPVVTVSLTADCTLPDVVAAAAEAVSLVEPGGIVQFESGGALPFVVSEDVTVAKPVTFQSADGGSPIIEVRPAPEAASQRGFHVNGVASGTVRFSGLTFITTSDAYSAVYAGPPPVAAATYDQVVVEGSTFMIAGTTGVFGGRSTVAGARVTVRNNTFSFLPNSWERGFGLLAVFGAGTGAVMIDIIGNQVTGPTGWGAFQYQSGASGRIENNTATQCGRVGCINVIGGPGAIVVGNTVSSAPGLGTQRGIKVGSENAVVTGNTVSGGFVGGDPTDPTSYGYTAAGISIGGGVNQTIDGNTISGAALGFEGSAAPQSVQDNVITGVLTAFSGTFGTNPLMHNDITNYVTPFTLTFGAGGLTCNWWGDTAGPQNIPVGANAATYTPWATAPIARGAGGTCPVSAGRPDER